jgi:hypothetical protein
LFIAILCRPEDALKHSSGTISRSIEYAGNGNATFSGSVRCVKIWVH